MLAVAVSAVPTVYDFWGPLESPAASGSVRGSGGAPRGADEHFLKTSIETKVDYDQVWLLRFCRCSIVPVIGKPEAAVVLTVFIIPYRVFWRLRPHGPLVYLICSGFQAGFAKEFAHRRRAHVLPHKCKLLPQLAARRAGPLTGG